MTGRILVADGNRALVQLLRKGLEAGGHVVDSVERADQVLALVCRRAPEVILLNRALSDGPDALTLCQMLQHDAGRVSIIVIADEDRPDERVRALRAGADDYVALPCAIEEIEARVEALLRRMQPPIDVVRLGSTIIDFRLQSAIAGRRRVPLTGREFEVLRRLAAARGGVVTRDELLQLVWGYSPTSLTRTVDNCVLRLRRKLEQDPHHPTFIRKVYGDGYRLVVSG